MKLKKLIEVAAAYLFIYAFARILMIYDPGLSSLAQGLVVQWINIYVLVVYYLYNRSESNALYGVFDLERVNVHQANMFLIVTVLVWASINIIIPWRIGPFDTTEIIVLGIIVAPIVEELFFRQFMLKELEFLGVIPALLISTLAFSLIHFGQYSMVIAIPMGLVLGYAYLQTRNIMVPIAMHFTYNLLALLLNT